MSFDMIDQGVTIAQLRGTDGVDIEVLPVRSRYGVRVGGGDIGTFEKMSKVKLPRKIGETKIDGALVSACLGPDEWFLRYSDENFEQLAEYIDALEAKIPCSVVDISFRNIAIKLSGPKAADAVNIGCPMDLSIEKFPVGKATRTIFEDAPIILIRHGKTEFTLEAWRSFTPYVLGLLTKHFSQT